MQIDEKIALLEKENRIQKKKEIEEAEKKESEEKKIIFTVEQFRKEIKRGDAFVGFKRLFVEPKEYLNQRITLPFIKDFYETIEEQDQVVTFISEAHTVFFSLVLIKEKQKRNSAENWKKQLKDNMKAAKFHCDMVKAESMEHLDYLCYETPTGKGKLYNVIFRILEEKQYYMGTINCDYKDKDSLGVFFEAMVQEINDYRKIEKAK